MKDLNGAMKISYNKFIMMVAQLDEFIKNFELCSWNGWMQNMPQESCKNHYAKLMVTNTIKLHTTGFYLYEILEKSWAMVTEDIPVDAWEWRSGNEVDCKGARRNFLLWKNYFIFLFGW